MSSKFFILFLFLLNLIDASSDQNIKKSNKHYNKHSVYKHGSCSKFDDTIPTTNEERRFMQLNSKNSNHINLASLRSVENENDTKQCTDNQLIDDHYKDLVTLKWRYQFIESLHCIRVELELGNVSRFIRYTNFKYYKFSYREIAKNNTYLKRQLVNDSVNSLTVYKVHLKPYIICVSFYKSRFDKLGNDSNSTDCNELNEFLENDERIHDIDMCIDIDTQLHFLSTPIEHDSFSGNRELLMVIFIICLSAVILSLITIGHYVIERPKKRRLMLHALRAYIQKKSHGSSDNAQLMSSSSQAIFKDPKSNGPAITVTDFSSSNNLNNRYEEEPKETEPMLNHTKSDYTPSFYNNNIEHVNNQHKVTFVIGETIIEEPATFSDSLTDCTALENNNANPNEESLKCISHLLDDKPWITSPTPPISQRMSRNNSVTSQNNPINY